MKDASSPLPRALGSLAPRTSLLRFRISTAMKARFQNVAVSFDTTPSALLRKFVILAATRPEVAQRLMVTHLPLRSRGSRDRHTTARKRPGTRETAMLLDRLGALPVRTAAIVAIILAIPLALARAQSPRPAIAAASVRWLCSSRASCAPLGGHHPSFHVDPRHYSCNMCFAEFVINTAYGIEFDWQATGYPNSWITFDTYRVDIATTAPVSRQQMQLLVRKVAAKCFQLRVHQTVKPVPGYALVVAPGGIKFPTVSPGSKPPVGGGNYYYQTIQQLLRLLNQSYYMGRAYGVTRPIHDATGLTGTYNIALPIPVPGTNLLHEIRRLGLEVKPAPGAEKSLKILHIHHLTKSCIMAPAKG